MTRSGNQKHYQAKRDAPIFAELHGLVVRTVGVVEPLRVALTLHASTIRAAFVYGSTAHGRDRTMSDIDVMVISDRLSYADGYDGLHAAEGMLGRPVNTDRGHLNRRVAEEAYTTGVLHRATRRCRETLVLGRADDIP